MRRCYGVRKGGKFLVAEDKIPCSGNNREFRFNDMKLLHNLAKKTGK
jgi:hypothetical protein